MELDDIKILINMLEGTDISEIDIEDEGNRIRIKKHPLEVKTKPSIDYSENTKVREETEQEEKNKDGNEIKSPMVGTFYRAPSPDSEPFVEVGDVIKPGDVLCIIEAMKLMNEIEAETKGRIVDILVGNAEPVEYGQPLFVIKPI